MAEFTPHDLAWSPELVRRYWEFEVTQVHNSFSRKYGHRIVHLARRYIPSGARVVDLGAGPGFLTAHLLAAGYVVASVEESLAGRTLCARRNGAQVGYLGSLAFDQIESTGPFEGAIGVELLEHLVDDEIAGLLSTLRRCLAPGSACVFTTPNREVLSRNIVGCPSCGARFHRWQHLRSVDADKMTRLLTAPGIEPVAVYATDWSRRVATLLQGRRRPDGPHLVGVARRT